MVNPSASIYVVSKVSAGHHAKLVHLPSSAWGSSHRVHVNEGVYLSITASSNAPVAGDISPNGKEVLTETKVELFQIMTCFITSRQRVHVY